MKHFKWPRPPLVLGFILGKVLERYMFISIQRYGADWMMRPIVIVFFLMAASSLLRPFLQDVRNHGGVKGLVTGFGKPHFKPRYLFTFGFICLFSVALFHARHWNIEAKIIPMIVGTGALLFCSLSLLNEVFAKPGIVCVTDLETQAKEKVAASSGGGLGGLLGGGGKKQDKMHMDIASHIEHMPNPVKLLRGSIFFGWMIGFLSSMAVIGLIPTVPIFVMGYMRLEGREPWRIVLPYAIVMTMFIYFLFDQLLAIPWPPTYIGDFFPALKAIPSV